MSLTTLVSQAQETCEANPVLAALADGIAHTDIGLTAATIILAIVTWNLIDDAKQDRIRHHVANLAPWRHEHIVIDQTKDDGEGHSESHTEIDTTRE